MRIAFTISSYRLFDFVHLGLRQIRRLRPDAPILISDDFSPESVYIRQFAKEHGVEFMGSEKRRAHFSGDCQSIVNSIAFAEAVGADVSVKVSQRFIFRLPRSIETIEKVFEDPTAAMAIPGQPKVAFGSQAAKGFSAFAVLSDVVCCRPSLFPAQRMLDIYRRRVTQETVMWKAFIEGAVHEGFNGLGPAARLLPELTDHTDPSNPIYLRRYQVGEQQYNQLAAEHGIRGRFPVGEWSQIEGSAYSANPVIV